MVYIRNIAKICVVAIAGVTFIWMPADMTAPAAFKHGVFID